MGEFVRAAKCTHVPTMLMSEQDGPVTGARQSASDGQFEIARRAKDLGADTVVNCDTHWMINANGRFEGLFASNEFPQFSRKLPYEYDGNAAPGWDRYGAQSAVATAYVPSSGTGQTNVIFPVQ